MCSLMAALLDCQASADQEQGIDHDGCNGETVGTRTRSQRIRSGHIHATSLDPHRARLGQVETSKESG
jgi:hypothetical protein